MGGRVSLALVIHNHQPVGNFVWVIEDVFEHAYAPLLAALERHPDVHLGLHYTGPLLQWMAAHRPDSLRQIRGLVDRGQVEIVGGGYYEPILVTLPDRDRHGQLVRMADELEQLFGRRPAGAWLAERVWEPSLAYDLAAAGYRWTVLDDTHLRAASVGEDEMWTAFTTDDRGLRLTVFGTEQGLRYRIPFRPVEPSPNKEARNNRAWRNEQAGKQQYNEEDPGDCRVGHQRGGESTLSDGDWPDPKTLAHVNRQRVKQADHQDTGQSRKEDTCA